jgi:cytochrome c-type biogenesis protein CcmH/NrfG
VHPPPKCLVTWLIVLVLALALVPIVAFAQGGGETKRRAAAPLAPSGKYTEACTRGNVKYASRDFKEAISLYRGAIELDPKNPIGHYLLGEAQLADGNIAEAEAAWNRALVESSEKDAALRGRILFVIADLKERQWKWDDAKAAWQVYLDWARAFPNGAGFPASANSRQQVIEVMLKQERKYEIVRRRIAETRDGGVFTDLSKSP